MKAVSFYTTATYADYEIKVFLDPDQGPVNSAGYKVSQSGNFDMPGYHTVVLNTPVPLKAGERFSVAVMARSPGWDFPVAIEYPISGYSGGATASAGQRLYQQRWRLLAGPDQFAAKHECLHQSIHNDVSFPGKDDIHVPDTEYSHSSGTSISTSAILKKLTGSAQVVGAASGGIPRNLSGALPESIS